MENIVQTVYMSTEMVANHPHFHDCHQIVFILKGRVEFCINGTVLPAGAGNAVILIRYENHSFRILSEEYRRYILQIDPAIVNQQSPVYTLLTDRPDGFRHIIDVSACLSQMTAIFCQLLSEHSAQPRLCREMEQLLVEQLLIAIYRCADLELYSPHDRIVMDVKCQLENNYAEQYTLDDLARRYSISVSSLAHRFRGVTGTSVMNFLQSCRMAHAKWMLAETNSSIAQIVESCGFSDSSNFSRTFKTQNGMSPTAFRKKHQA